MSWACSSRPPVPPPACAVRADARAGPGRDDPRGGQRPRTAPGPAHTPALPRLADRTARAGVPPPVPVEPGARPPGHPRQSGDVRPVTGGPAGRQPWAGAGCVPRVRRSRGTGPPVTGRAHEACPAESMTWRAVSPGRGRSWAEPAAAAAPAGRQAGVRSGLPGPTLLAAVSRVTARPPGWRRPGWSSGERDARVGSGGVYAVSCPVAVRQACSTARSRAAIRVSRAAMAWRLRRP